MSATIPASGPPLFGRQIVSPPASLPWHHDERVVASRQLARRRLTDHFTSWCPGRSTARMTRSRPRVDCVPRRMSLKPLPRRSLSEAMLTKDLEGRFPDRSLCRAHPGSPSSRRPRWWPPHLRARTAAGCDVVEMCRPPTVGPQPGHIVYRQCCPEVARTSSDRPLPPSTTTFVDPMAAHPQLGQYPWTNEVEGLNRGWAHGTMSLCPVA